jgi:WD40 repeat protein
VRPLLIFDQFEEWTTLVQDASLGGKGEEARAAQRRIAEVILSLVRDRGLPVKVMLALREDYLGTLTPLVDEFPDFTDSYVRLQALSGDDILEMVCGPFTKGGYPHAIPEELAKTIRDEFVRKSSGGPIRSTEVQIVCERLYFDVAEGDTWGAAYVRREGVQGILEGHLEGRLSRLPPAARDQAVALLGCLLTADGTRNVVSEPTLLSTLTSDRSWSAESLRSTLRGLEREAHLIVQSARRGVSFYEVASEFLVPWIRARTEELRVAREREAAERQRLLAAKQRKAKVLKFQGLAGLIVVLLGALFVLIRAQASMRRAGAVHVLDAVTQYAMRNTAADPQLGLLLALDAVSLGRRTAGTPTLASVDALRQAMAATPRMRLRLAGHRGGVAAVDVSPGGEYIATAGEDSTVRIWDAEGGILLQTFAGLPGVRDVAFSAGGRSIATASDDTVRVWDAFGGRRLLALPAARVARVAYSPDGRLLAAGDDQGWVQVWRLDGGARPDTLPGRCTAIASLAFSPDGARLAAGCFNGSGIVAAIIWSLAHRSRPLALRGTQAAILGVAFSPDGTRLATAGSCCPRVVIWDARSGDPLGAIAGHVNAATGVAFSPDGSLLATVGRDRMLRVVHGVTGRLLRAVAGHAFWIEDVAFFPDGKRLVTASKDSTAVVWDVAAPGGAQLRALRGHADAVQDVVASAESQVLVSLDRSGHPLWWDAATGDSLRAGDSLSRWQSATPGTLLALGGDHLVMNTHGDLSFWSIGSRRVEDSLVGHRVTVFALAGDSLVAAFTADSSLIVRNLKTGKSASFATAVPPADLMAASPDGRRVLVLPAGQGALLDAESGRVLAAREFPFQVRTAAFSPDGRLIAVGGDAQAVELLDAGSLRELRRLPHGDIVTDVAFSRSGRLLASASRDGTAAVWDPDSGTIVAVFGGHEEGATSVAFLPGDRRVAVGAEDGIVRIHALDADDLVPAALDLAVRPLSRSECHSMQLLQCPTATDLIVEGRRLALAGRVPEAVTAFDSAGRLGLALPVEAERAARALAARALVTGAHIHLEAGRMDSARAVFVRAETFDSSVDTRTMLVEAAARHANADQLAEAGEILRLGATSRWYRRGSQRDANLLNQLGSRFLTENRLDDAALAYGFDVAAVEGLGDYDRSSAYNNFAYVLALKKERLDSAATLVSLAIRIGGPLPEYLDTQAWVAYQAGRCAAAVAPIDSALAASRSDAEIAGHYVTIHCTCGDQAKAKAVVRGWKRPVPKELTQASVTFCRR